VTGPDRRGLPRLPPVPARLVGFGILRVGAACFFCRRPARKQTERLRGARFSSVGDDHEAGVEADLEPVEAELLLSHARTVELLDALGMQPDVVGGPEPAELLALGGELADEV
jgi:hypothetical protein